MGAKSDRVFAEITSIQGALTDWEPNSAATVQKAKKLIRVYEDEGLHAFLDTAYGHATLTFSAVGNKEGALKYARLAAESVRFTNGPHAPDFEMWNQFIKSPETHWSWRYRSGKT